MSPITKSRIEELRKMESEATDRDWIIVQGELFAPVSGYAAGEGAFTGTVNVLVEPTSEDVEFIAALRNSSKSLLDLAAWALEAKEVLQEIEEGWRYIDGTKKLA